jgi:hypothetical protein
MANIDAYDNRLDECLRLANNHKQENNFDIRQQLHKAFGYDEPEDSFQIAKRRGAVGSQMLNVDHKDNTSRVLHIRQTWDDTLKITPYSSMKSSEFSRLNKMDESESSSSRPYLESFTNLPNKSSKFYGNMYSKSVSPIKRKGSAQIMQKVLNSLRGDMDKMPYKLSGSKVLKSFKKIESVDIISKAKAACNQYLEQIEHNSS